MVEHEAGCGCASCFDKQHDAQHPSRVEGCLACKLRGEIYLSRKATPTKSPSAAEPHRPDPAWERGIATDERGMPFLGKGGAPIGVKEYGERRHEIDDWRRRLRQD